MSPTRSAAIILLVAAAGLFAIGTTIEKNRDHHDEPTATAGTGETHDEAGQSAEHREAEERAAHAEDGESEEGKVLGIDRESTGLLVLAVIASLALAAVLWRRPQRLVWIAVGLAATTFAVFDVAEVAHQLDESASGLAAVAALVAAAHLAVAAIAARNAATPQRPARSY